MKYPLFYVIFGLVFAIIFATLPLYNYVVDWYSIFSKLDSKGIVYIKKAADKGTEQLVQLPLFRYRHAETTIKKHNKDIVVIFGSSRVGLGYNGTYMANAFGRPVCKLQYPFSGLHEILHNIKLLQKNNAIPRKLLVTIDDISLIIGNKIPQNINRMPPPLTLQQTYDYWKKILFRLPAEGELRTLLQPQRNPLAVLSSLEGISQKKNTSDFIDYLLCNNYIKQQWGKPLHNSEVLEDIKEIISIVKQNGSEVTFLITPLYITTYMASDIAGLETFKRELANITPFYDFALVSEENSYKDYWLEPNHFTTQVGNKIIDTVVAEAPDRLWGHKVTKTNVESHLLKLRENILANIDPWLKTRPDGEINPATYRWLNPAWSSRSDPIKQLGLLGEWEENPSDPNYVRCTAKTISFTIPEGPPHADRVLFNLGGVADMAYYSRPDTTRTLQIFVNNQPYAKVVFGNANYPKGRLPNKKQITLVGDFSNKTTVSIQAVDGAAFAFLLGKKVHYAGKLPPRSPLPVAEKLPRKSL